MRWRRLGKVFDPADHGLPDGCTAFAQAPQALVFEDFVRVYFSTRAVDAHGKFLSHVAFVDLRKNLRDVIGVSRRPALPLGELGCFDEHGIFPMNVLRVGDQIWGYTTGWNRRVSVSVDTAIGLVVSRDGGSSFKRIGDGPVLGPSLREPCLVGDAFVRQIAGSFHMWYIFGTGWRREAPQLAAERTYKIGHAVSSDGIEWRKEEARQIVVDRLGADESQALPTVIALGERWHMFFCYRESFDFRRSATRGYRIGHAWSDDLVDWTRDDDDPFLPLEPYAWDSDMQCYPNVFECEGRIYLLYNGNEFGRHGFGLAVLET
jgi:hypothetical protein